MSALPPIANDRRRRRLQMGAEEEEGAAAAEGGGGTELAAASSSSAAGATGASARSSSEQMENDNPDGGENTNPNPSSSSQQAGQRRRRRQTAAAGGDPGGADGGGAADEAAGTKPAAAGAAPPLKEAAAASEEASDNVALPKQVSKKPPRAPPGAAAAAPGTPPSSRKQKAGFSTPEVSSTALRGRTKARSSSRRAQTLEERSMRAQAQEATPEDLVPPPNPDTLMTDEERELLGLPLRGLVAADDKYPVEAEPHFLIEPPAPGLGDVHERFVELPGTERAFRRINPNLDGAPPGMMARPPLPPVVQAPLFDEPSWGVQLVAFLVGLALQLSQGALAGLCFFQCSVSPWPERDEGQPFEGQGQLVKPMMYASVALPLHRLLQILALCAFLASCDLHAADPKPATVFMMLLHALVVITLVLELPTSVALHLHRKEQVPTVQWMLDGVLAGNSSGINPLTGLLESIQYEPRFLPPFQYPTPVDGVDYTGLFSTSLNQGQMGIWQALIVMRMIFAGVAWLVSCIVQSRPAFEVPPISYDHLSSIQSGGGAAGGGGGAGGAQHGPASPRPRGGADQQATPTMSPTRA